MKIDYRFPLPLERLHARFDPVFDALKSNQSVHLIGLPHSGRSGYLKFILENQDIAQEFYNTSKYIFVVLEPADITGSFPKTLILKLLAKEVIYMTELISHALKSNDHTILQETIIAELTKLKDTKLVLVLYEPEQILQKNELIAMFLAHVLDINRTPPNSVCLLMTISSPSFLDRISSPEVYPLHLFLEERRVYFPLFEDIEMEYLRKRLMYLLNIQISDELSHDIRAVADGHTILYRTMVNIAIHEDQNDNNKLEGLLKIIYESLGKKQQEDIERDKFTKNPILLKLNLVDSVKQLRINFKALIDESKNKISARDHLLKMHFIDNPDVLISRDDLAKILWGDNWENKYSDWALDQAIYSVRKYLPSSYNLHTLRNRGYIYTLK